jgi:putative transposase
VLQGLAWQRCVHFMRNALGKVNKDHAEMAAATICTLFAQRRPNTGRAQVDTVADTFARQLPAVVDLLHEAKAKLTTFTDFPHAHRRKIWSTNSLPSGSTDMEVSSGPTRTSTRCCARPRACSPKNNRVAHSERRYLSEESMALLNPPRPTALEPG